VSGHRPSARSELLVFRLYPVENLACPLKMAAQNHERCKHEYDSRARDTRDRENKPNNEQQESACNPEDFHQRPGHTSENALCRIAILSRILARCPCMAVTGASMLSETMP